MWDRPLCKKEFKGFDLLVFAIFPQKGSCTVIVGDAKEKVAK